MKTQYARMIGEKRNMNRFKPEGWILAIVVVFLMTCLIIGFIQTRNSFIPSAQAIMAKQDEMLARCDTMQSELTALSEAVEAMPVVIVDETIPKLADPNRAVEVAK